jgi:hypothetical protein
MEAKQFKINGKLNFVADDLHYKPHKNKYYNNNKIISLSDALVETYYRQYGASKNSKNIEKTKNL